MVTELRRGQMSLLPHQIELLAAARGPKKKRKRVLQGGYRGGKTVGGVAAVYDMGCRSAGYPILAVAPTYRLIRDVFVATAIEWFGKWRMPCSYHESKNILTVGGPRFRFQVLCRSADKPRSIEGLTVGGLLVDEWELCSREALIVSMARVSAGPCQEMVFTGTAEGYGAGYELLLAKPDPDLWFKSIRTSDNTELRATYDSDMRGQMDPEMAAEKLDGVRRAKGGRVYHSFDRETHGAAPIAVPKGSGQIQIWADFNVEHMCWVVVETDRAKKACHIVGELIGGLENDTAKHAEAMKKWLVEYFRVARGHRCSVSDVEKMKIPVYCDASASWRNVATTATTHHLLKQAGFKPMHGPKNPPVDNRVDTVLAMLRERRLTVDLAAAPWTVQCFERQTRVNGEPDKTGGFDHAMDAVGYGCFWQFPVWRRPEEAFPIVFVT